MNEVEKLRDDSSLKKNSQIFNEDKKALKNKAKITQLKSKIKMIVTILRTIMRELVLEIEKLRNKINAMNKINNNNNQLDKKFYAESMNILKLSYDEISQFIKPDINLISNPNLNPNPNSIENLNLETGDLGQLMSDINALETKEPNIEILCNSIIDRFKQFLKEFVELDRKVSISPQKIMKRVL